MTYKRIPVSLSLATDVTHQCWIHRTRDSHLIGIIELKKPDTDLTWGDIEYCRRRVEELSVMPFPECISAIIIDIQNFGAFIDNDIALLPWRMQEEDCPIRMVVKTELFEMYTAIFEATWLCTDLDLAIREIREFMDMFVH